MLGGLDYLAFGPELTGERNHAHQLCRDFDRGDPKAKEALHAIFGARDSNLYIEPPFFCDYGWNVFFGSNVYLNSGCLLLDCAPIYVGDLVKFGPGVHVYTAGHPLDAQRRADGFEFARPVRIGRNSWIGGRATLLPGITIGENCVIGAGSVVTRDVAPNTTVAGNPARVLHPK